MYKTKTQKKNAINSVKSKCKKLWLGDLISTQELVNVNKAMDRAMRKL